MTAPRVDANRSVALREAEGVAYFMRGPLSGKVRSSWPF